MFAEKVASALASIMEKLLLPEKCANRAAIQE
jgi:hypothetical protein